MVDSEKIGNSVCDISTSRDNFLPFQGKRRQARFRLYLIRIIIEKHIILLPRERLRYFDAGRNPTECAVLFWKETCVSWRDENYGRECKKKTRATVEERFLEVTSQLRSTQLRVGLMAELLLNAVVIPFDTENIVAFAKSSGQRTPRGTRKSTCEETIVECATRIEKYCAREECSSRLISAAAPVRNTNKRQLRRHIK